MASRNAFRLFIYLLYLGVVFLAGGYVYQRLQRFDGDLLIAKGSVESVVIRPAGEGLAFSAAHRNLPAEVIPFDNPRFARRRLDASLLYDGASLPFRLRLDGVEVLEERPPRDVIAIERGGARQEVPISAGSPVAWAGGEATITAIRPWSGLIRNVKGDPMAALSIRRGDVWQEGLLLRAGEWQRPSDRLAVHFAWFETEAAAAEALSAQRPGLESARWGVLDGRTMHWFRTFEPGTGVLLEDGSDVTLLHSGVIAAEDGGTLPAILLAVFRDGNETQVRVDAGGSLPNERFRFEYPASAETVVVLHAWRDGRARLRAFTEDTAAPAASLDTGQSWAAPESEALELRLDQVMSRALPARTAEAAVWEAVLKTPDGEQRLREGETVAVGNQRLRYRRIPTPPVVRYRLSVLQPGEEPRSITLGPQDRRRVGVWRLGQAGGNVEAATNALLHATRTLGGPAQLLGASLFMFGAFAMVLARFLHAPGMGRRIDASPPEPYNSDTAET